MFDLLKKNWRLYVYEGLGLTIFMASAGLFASALFYPGSPLFGVVREPAAKFAVLGLLMFPVIAFGIAGAPWGKKTGAHVNPAVTLAFLRLGRISKGHAFFYIVGQFGGAYLGVAIAALVWHDAYASPAVHYGSTVPGPAGPAVAFAIELVMTFLLVMLIQHLEAHKELKGRAPFYIAGLIAFYLATATPFTGMSLNPARTMGSATYALEFKGVWIYFAAPIAGALLAVELYRRLAPHRLDAIRFPPEG